MKIEYVQTLDDLIAFNLFVLDAQMYHAQAVGMAAG